MTNHDQTSRSALEDELVTARRKYRELYAAAARSGQLTPMSAELIELQMVIELLKQRLLRIQSESA